MPVTTAYPGVYIEEIPSGVRTITGVSTSLTAFVGYTQRGPTDKATQIFSMSDYERNFGDLEKDSEVSYAIRQFFQNGGGKAWIVRVAKNAKKASISLRNKVAAGVEVLKAEAISEGDWGNNLCLSVDWNTSNPDSLFNISVIEYVEQNGELKVAHTEKFKNLTMNREARNYAVNVVKAGSDLIRLMPTTAAATAVATEHGNGYSGVLNDADFGNLDDNHRRIAVTINGDGPHEFNLFDVGGSIAGADLATKLSQLAQKIKLTVQNIKPTLAFTGFTCQKVPGKDQIFARSGEDGENASVHFSNAGVNNATDILNLGVENGGTEIDGAAAIMPCVSGTLGDDIGGLDLTTLPATASINVTIKSTGLADEGPHAVTLWTGAANRPTTFEKLSECIKTALAGTALPLSHNPIAVLNEASVTFYDNRLHVSAGGSNPDVNLEFTNATGTTADDLGLSAAGNAQVNIARYALGVGSTSLAQSTKIPGFDGIPPGADELIGEKAKKTGLYALEDADIFNILSIPGTMNLDDNSAAHVAAKATKYCEERRAFYILDIPHNSKSRDSVSEVKTWLDNNSSLRHKNAAVYFPRPFIADALKNYRLRAVAPSGTMAGLYARIDGQRGVWKAPAGTEAVLSGVQKIEYLLTDEENGALNPLGINCLRKFDVYGNVCWGGRTLDGDDQKASEWKYIPVRRTALFIEESLYRGTKWVVFEPNDEPLWSQIRLNVGAFMHGLFRQGAFQGTTPKEAYFVKCDKETTTQDDINHGIVNILVGFAPLKPAEFVIIKIQQIAGHIET